MYIIISSSDFSLPEAYKQIIDTDILARIDPLVDWNSMRLIVSSLFHNHAEKGGGPMWMRSPGEIPYSMIKGRFNGGYVHVTKVRRVRVKMRFKCLCYYLFTLVNLKKCGKIEIAV
jgi:hypothetical protein